MYWVPFFLKSIMFFWSRADAHRSALYCDWKVPFGLASPWKWSEISTALWVLANCCCMYGKMAVVQLCRALREFLIFFQRHYGECTESKNTQPVQKQDALCKREALLMKSFSEECFKKGVISSLMKTPVLSHFSFLLSLSSHTNKWSHC